VDVERETRLVPDPWSTLSEPREKPLTNLHSDRYTRWEVYNEKRVLTLTTV